MVVNSKEHSQQNHLNSGLGLMIPSAQMIWLSGRSGRCQQCHHCIGRAWSYRWGIQIKSTGGWIYGEVVGLHIFLMIHRGKMMETWKMILISMCHLAKLTTSENEETKKSHVFGAYLEDHPSKWSVTPIHKPFMPFSKGNHPTWGTY